MFRKHKESFHRNMNRNLITISDPKSPISEQYRTLRTNLEYTSLGTGLQTILVTSTFTGEGKSTTAGNLAVVYAQLGKRVLVVDCDMRRPTMHQIFRLDTKNGLSNVLAKRVTIDLAIQQTQLENLYVMTAGVIPPNPSELLSAPSFKEMLDQVQTQFDIIILDAPPVMQVADSRVIATEVDGTVLVVSCEASDRDEVVKARDQLTMTGTKILGLVLNRREYRKDRNNYYYAYH
ncbi:MULTISPECIES: CpsD/CapB family tyrosine-protein kinase [unclassified Exiguobacterium]|uniref:CpsD/CapB family tyrosine-protein kinase n=2 Tax=unclassified Exiguobacterium TaxID=2644629 RepID=UPI001BE6EA2E|nr:MULTISPECIES: CpsD/CapB family tyrosine-protein kinase [unclassified Exiguobacterium]